MGNEIDCLLEEGKHLTPIEIKSSATIDSSMFEGLTKWCELASLPHHSGTIIYGGEEQQSRKQGKVLSWKLL